MLIYLFVELLETNVPTPTRILKQTTAILKTSLKPL